LFEGIGPEEQGFMMIDFDTEEMVDDDGIPFLTPFTSID